MKETKPEAAAVAALSPTCCWILGFAALVGAVFGVVMSTVLHGAVDTALHKGISEQFSIASPSAQGYAAWQNTDAPNGAASQTDFFVYHINNPNDMVLKRAKPNVTLIGPLHYSYQ